jgi:hypothetical protein
LTQFPDPQKSLIAFFKQYRPFPPQEPQGLENQIMARIRLESQARTQHASRLWWGIPGVLMAGAVILWGSSQTLQPTAPIASSSEDIEAFLWENWTVPLGQSPALPSFSTTPMSREWEAFSEPQTVLVEVQP